MAIKKSHGILLALVMVFLFGIPSPQAQTYQPWQGNKNSAQLDQMITELRQLIKQAESDRAADPTFLRDLKKLADKYQNAGAGTGTTASSQSRIFYDDFGDGEFHSNPAWKVSAGIWSVDRSGQNIGLVSKVGRPLSADTLLGVLLTPQGNTQQNAYASIYSPVAIPPAFTLKMRFTSKDLFGSLNISPYQGASGQNSYRLVYQPGAGLTLQLVQGQNVQNIGSYPSRLNLEDGRSHDLTWSRDSYGRMEIGIDGKKLINVADSTLNGNFNGLLLINSGGAYWIRSVEIDSL